jgi:hypothetical protein
MTPASQDFKYSINHNNKAFTKLINMMNSEIANSIAWSPYAINTYKDYIKRGDNLKLNQLLQDTRIKIQEAADARLNYNVA